MQPVGQVGSARRLCICSREIRAGGEGTCPGFVWALERGQTRNWSRSGVPVTSRVRILGATSQTRVKVRSTSVSQCPDRRSRPVGEDPGLVGAPQGPGAGAEAAVGLSPWVQRAEARMESFQVEGRRRQASPPQSPGLFFLIFNLGVELAVGAARCSSQSLSWPSSEPSWVSLLPRVLRAALGLS